MRCKYVLRFVDLFNCRVAKPRLAGRLVFYLFIFIVICPQVAKKVELERP